MSRPPPPPTINEDMPRQTPYIQVSGFHHDCVSQGSGPECCHTTISYSYLGNDCSAADAAPPLDNVNRQLINFLVVFQLNGLGLVFSHF